MAEKASSRTPRAIRLLLKAIGALPEREQQVVLAYLLERGLGPAAMPSRSPAPSLTPEFVVEVGAVAGRMLRSGDGVAAIAGLYGLPEDVVRAALHDVVSDPEAPQPLASMLELLGQGLSPERAARELRLSQEEASEALDRLPSSPLERRLGKALFAHARVRSQASSAFLASMETVEIGPGRRAGRQEPGPRTGSSEGMVTRLGRMLLAGCDPPQIAEACDLHEAAVRTALREAAAEPAAPETLASVLALIAAGSTLAEVPGELGLSEEEVRSALEELLPSPLERRLNHALQASVAVRSVEAPRPSPALPGLNLGGSLGGEPQMVPVRFPEPQYRRLKEWCGRHGFSMAVVVRGLVERFLDDQDRRAA